MSKSVTTTDTTSTTDTAVEPVEPAVEAVPAGPTEPITDATSTAPAPVAVVEFVASPVAEGEGTDGEGVEATEVITTELSDEKLAAVAEVIDRMTAAGIWDKVTGRVAKVLRDPASDPEYLDRAIELGGQFAARPSRFLGGDAAKDSRPRGSGSGLTDEKLADMVRKALFNRMAPYFDQLSKADQAALRDGGTVALQIAALTNLYRIEWPDLRADALAGLRDYPDVAGQVAGDNRLPLLEQDFDAISPHRRWAVVGLARYVMHLVGERSWAENRLARLEERRQELVGSGYFEEYPGLEEPFTDDLDVDDVELCIFSWEIVTAVYRFNETGGLSVGATGALREETLALLNHPEAFVAGADMKTLKLAEGNLGHVERLAGMTTARTGKTARDRASGAHTRHLANRADTKAVNQAAAAAGRSGSGKKNS